MINSSNIAIMTFGSNSASISRDAETLEFIVRLYINGVHQEDADYFTDSMEDAISTAEVMVGHISVAPIRDHELDFLTLIGGKLRQQPWYLWPAFCKEAMKQMPEEWRKDYISKLPENLNK